MNAIAHVKTDTIAHESALPQGVARFLANILEHATQAGLRHADDFIRHFPPHKLMQALADEAELRANILEPTTGVRRKIALRKSPVSAADDLQFALDERETDAAAICTHFRIDERVEHLVASDLWAYLAEKPFWTTIQATAEGKQAEHRHLAYIIGQALDNGLLIPQDILSALQPDQLAEYFPKELVSEIFTRLFETTRKGKIFGDDAFFQSTPPMTLVRFLPGDVLWKQIVEPLVFRRHVEQHAATKNTAPVVEPVASPAKAAAASASTTDIPVAASVEEVAADAESTASAASPGSWKSGGSNSKGGGRLTLKGNNAPQSKIEYSSKNGKSDKAGEAQTQDLQDLVDDAFESLQG